MPNDEPPPPDLLRLDKRDTAHALLQAMGRRRFGHAKHIMESTLHGVVAELIADALLDGGYVLTLPKRRDPMDRASLHKPKDPHLTE